MRKACIWKWDDILKATSGVLVKKGTFSHCSGVSTDSRVLNKGDLFIAIKGTQYDGHGFIPSAIKKGAAGIIMDKYPDEMSHFEGAVIKVDNTVKALGNLAKYHHMKYRIPMVAITGSNGKTTTKEMTAHILSLSKRVLKNEANYNNHIGVPFTLLAMDGSHEIGVIEIATNQPGEIDYLASIVMPEIGVITSIHPVHLRGLKDIEGVKKEKGSLLKYINKFIFNADDDRAVSLSEKFSGEKVGFGIKRGEVKAKDINENGLSGTAFTLCLTDKYLNVKYPILGRHQIYNALAAATVARILDISPLLIKKGLETFVPIKGRLNIFKGKNGVWVLDDSYNANPQSVLSALEVLKGLPGEKIVVLGDMLELGEAGEAWHEKIGKAVACVSPNYFIVFGHYKESLIKGALGAGLSSERTLKANSHKNILLILKKISKKDDILLIKASHALGFERLVSALAGER